ncbi:hypothetical protein TNCV_4018001 [Trichonephila clavipes]|nr:hypothetical protein TNCV_4018001 [Trichonephila clavipes]
MISSNHMCCRSCNGSQEPFFNKALLSLILQERHSLFVTLWPAQSPHLSPIENIWDNFGRQINLEVGSDDAQELLVSLNQELTMNSQKYMSKTLKNFSL